jgi:hypothetical protein
MTKRAITSRATTTKADDTLSELWQIKDETATRYRTATAYFSYLGLVRTSPPLSTKRTPRSKSARAATV